MAHSCAATRGALATRQLEVPWCAGRPRAAAQNKDRNTKHLPKESERETQERKVNEASRTAVLQKRTCRCIDRGQTKIKTKKGKMMVECVSLFSSPTDPDNEELGHDRDKRDATPRAQPYQYATSYRRTEKKGKKKKFSKST
jgi:hypothetical protein